jgi:hypothetical protein
MAYALVAYGYLWLMGYPAYGTSGLPPVPAKAGIGYLTTQPLHFPPEMLFFLWQDSRLVVIIKAVKNLKILIFTSQAAAHLLDFLSI